MVALVSHAERRAGKPEVRINQSAISMHVNNPPLHLAQHDKFDTVRAAKPFCLTVSDA